MNLATATPLAISNLAAQGFTTVEITCTQRLKAHYDPYREYCESNREYEQLCFLKWRYERGEIREATTD